MQTDDIDHQLVAALSADGRATYREIADTVGVSVATVRTRLDALEDADIIQGYSVDLDYEALGSELTVVFQFDVDGDALGGVSDWLASFDRIDTVYETTGSFDVLALGRFDSPAELNERLGAFHRNNEIQQTTANISPTVAAHHQRLLAETADSVSDSGERTPAESRLD